MGGREGRTRNDTTLHCTALRLVDVDEQQAADGVPRAHEVLLEVLHGVKDASEKERACAAGKWNMRRKEFNDKYEYSREDALAEDVVQGVGVAEKAGPRLVVSYESGGQRAQTSLSIQYESGGRRSPVQSIYLI